MRNSETHQRKKSKNYALLVVLLLVMATFFSVTMVKLQQAGENAKLESAK
jgi:hypothetical protein